MKGSPEEGMLWYGVSAHLINAADYGYDNNSSRFAEVCKD
jgi:hypothetical protein